MDLFCWFPIVCLLIVFFDTLFLDLIPINIVDSTMKTMLIVAHRVEAYCSSYYPVIFIRTGYTINCFYHLSSRIDRDRGSTPRYRGYTRSYRPNKVASCYYLSGSVDDGCEILSSHFVSSNRDRHVHTFFRYNGSDVRWTRNRKVSHSIRRVYSVRSSTTSNDAYRCWPWNSDISSSDFSPRVIIRHYPVSTNSISIVGYSSYSHLGGATNDFVSYLSFNQMNSVSFLTVLWITGNLDEGLR